MRWQNRDWSYINFRGKLIIVTLPLLLIVLAVFYFGWLRALPFDASAWQAHGQRQNKAPIGRAKPPPSRMRMVDDLLKNHLQEGMTRSQVRALLGDGEVKGNTYIYYELSTSPPWHQSQAALRKWGTSYPYLMLTFAPDKGKLRLHKVVIGAHE